MNKTQLKQLRTTLKPTRLEQQRRTTKTGTIDGLTQGEMAIRMALTVETYRSYENGRRTISDAVAEKALLAKNYREVVCPRCKGKGVL